MNTQINICIVHFANVVKNKRNIYENFIPGTSLYIKIDHENILATGGTVVLIMAW